MKRNHAFNLKSKIEVFLTQGGEKLRYDKNVSISWSKLVTEEFSFVSFSILDVLFLLPSTNQKWKVVAR